MYEFLTRLLIALIIFVPTVIFAAKYFQFGDKGQESYQNFVSFLEEVNKEEGDLLKSTILTLKKNTFIIAFNKDAKTLEAIRSPTSDRVKFFKPDGYENKAVICLCTGFNSQRVEGGAVGTGRLWEIYCKKSLCRETNINFLNRSTKKIGLTQSVEWKGGFIIHNGVTLSAGYYLDDQFGVPKAEKIIAVEKYKGLITTCTESPCLTQEMKETRYDAKESEVGKHNYTVGSEIFFYSGVYSDNIETYTINGFKKDILGFYYYDITYLFKDDSKTDPPRQDTQLIQEFDNFIDMINKREGYTVDVQKS